MELLLPVFAERAGADRAEIQFFLLLGAAILAIKLAFLWIDNELLFFIGDSGAYLASALGGPCAVRTVLCLWPGVHPFPTLAVRLAARGGRRSNGHLGGLGVAARGGAAGRL